MLTRASPAGRAAESEGTRAPAGTGVELWVGPEATVNRVGERYFDQLEATGFARRVGDIDRLASTGARCVRFPLLWERVAPEPGVHRWRWSDLRLARVRALGVEPIAGLVHHGSGPRYTDLLDPAFAEKLAAYARAAAERYPWITAWTPVNEPVTTARFSGLYGLWYPHRRDDASFVRALVNEVRGVVLAMRAVRAVNPVARLVQTDDIGFVQGTTPLRYQAAFENSRRWLAFDLLTGRVDASHPLWGYLLWAGASERELMAFAEDPLPPDIIGINAYVTSERFLDHRLDLYPQHLHGGNGRDAYVDVERVRVAGEGIGGFAARIAETHARFGLPVAITEVHLGCTREEQLRWLAEAWRAATEARARGIDVRAVTAWAAFGAVDWNSLVTVPAGHYESGLWDTRARAPRPTAILGLARALAGNDTPAAPVLAGPGWWRREARFTYPVHGVPHAEPARGAPVLITGATGTLGRAFARLCELRGIPCRLTSRAELDIARASSVRAAIARWNPWAIVNAAGYVRVDDAEADARQWRENALGPVVLAAACAREGIRLVSFSSDLVFDGAKSAPYVERDPPNPLNAYGRAKRASELEVLARYRRALVIRTAAFFGPWDEHNFVAHVAAALREGRRFGAANDEWVSPTYVPDLVHATLDLLVDGESGIWHLANRGAVTWFEFACMAAETLGMERAPIDALPGASLGRRAPRPRYVPLASERGSPMGTLEQALGHYLHDMRDAARDAARAASPAAAEL